MKKYLVLFLLILGTLLVLPFATGFKAEEQYQALIGQLQQNGLQLIVHDYRRGWFGATSESEFSIGVPAASAAPASPPQPEQIRLILTSVISHGPLTAAGVGLAQIESQVRMADPGPFSQDYAGALETQIGLSGSGYTLVEWPPAEFGEQAERPAILFGGLSGRIDFDLIRETADVRLSLPAMTVSRQGSPLLEMGEANMDSNSWVGKTGLTLGSGSLTLGSLTIADGESGGQIVISDLGLEVESTELGDLVGGSASYRVGALDVGEQVYGPGLLRIELARLSGPVLLRLKQAMGEIRGNSMTEAQQGMAILSMAGSSGPELLRNDPQIAIRPVRLTTPDGLLEAGFSLRSVGLRWEDIYQRQTLMNKLVADLSLRIPETLLRELLRGQIERQLLTEIAAVAEQGSEPPVLEPDQLQALVTGQADQQLKQWLQQELLVRDGKDLTSVASLSAGLLTVNGKQVPLP